MSNIRRFPANDSHIVNRPAIHQVSMTVFVNDLDLQDIGITNPVNQIGQPG